MTEHKTEHACAWLNAAGAGALSGALGKVAEHPLDTIKVRYQLGEAWPRTVGQLYRGLPAPLFGACAEAGTLFGVHGAVVNALGNSRWGGALGGGLAGAAVATFLTPVELVKCKAQSSRTGRVSLWRSLGDLSRTGLYAGHRATLLREVPGTAVWFSVFAVAKKKLAREPEPVDPPGWHSAVAGGMAGMAYWASIYPVDTLKTRMQVDGHTTLRDSFAAGQGDRWARTTSLYRGFTATLLRAIPGNAVTFWAYEHLTRDD